MKNSKIIGGLKGRSLLRDIDLTKDQFMALLDLAEILRTEKKSDTE